MRQMTWPNHALQRTRPSRPGCKRTPSWAGSLSLGRSTGEMRQVLGGLRVCTTGDQ
jgi:hypothetical protein